MLIRAVIFDFGNVLSLIPGPKEFLPLYELSGLDEARFQQAFWRYRLQYDRGSLDGTAYWQAIATETGVALGSEQIRKLIAADIALWKHLNPSLVAWVHSLREDALKTAVLSNMPIDLARILRQNPEWMPEFDYAVLSAEVGLLKPEPEIYLACLAGLNVRPDEALFIDDTLANVEGARAVGMQALRFESAARLAEEITPFGLPPLRVV